MSLVHSTQDTDPVYTSGNWFWKDDERFLIKGISYLPRAIGGDPYGNKSKIDPFDDSRLGELERDIQVIQELGLNTIQVSALQPGKCYAKAMDLLADAGIHVLVTLFEDFGSVRFGSRNPGQLHPNELMTDWYTADVVKPGLQIADEVAKYPNLLAFVVGVEVINQHSRSKLAEVYAGMVRDVKSFLRQRDGRCPAVGVSINDVLMLRKLMLEYFTAGSRERRADFVAMDCWSWANKSNFQISGWKNMVEMLAQYPVPMYLSAFGTNAGVRLWEEIGCLYSPDMTGVFSGGCLYTYFESRSRYGIVDVRGSEVERKGEEFGRLKQQLHAVNMRDEDEVFTSGYMDYENWVGEVPGTNDWWLATPDLPVLEPGLENLIQEIRNEKRGDADTSVAHVTEEVRKISINGEN